MLPLLMAAILPAIQIDSDRAVSNYFLPYQQVWIQDDSRMRLAEKSVRIGWTYCDAFKNVRKRLLHQGRDYLFATKDQPSAVEYMEQCKKFCEIFDLTKGILSHGEEYLKIEKPDGVTEEIKIFTIKFDNGSRIIAFSSNPYAMAVFGGDVGIDEFAKHPQEELLWETAQGRITWGYDIGVWSAHDGNDTLFYQFAQEAAAGNGGWSHYRVTMADALDLGLLEKINQLRNLDWTKEQFLDDCRTRARLPEIYEQAYNCNPMGSSSAIVPWSVIQNCMSAAPIERAHWEAKAILDTFGAYDKTTGEERGRRIRNAIRADFDKLFSRPARHLLGFDVAASGAGDLAAIYVDRLEGSVEQLSGLFTCRTDDWNFLETVLHEFLQRTAALRATGDETGLGKQICWTAAKLFPGLFTPVNFTGSKHNMGTDLMNKLANQEKRFPKADEHRDIAQDFFSLRKLSRAGRFVFSEGKNILNPNSHCDIAWAGGLAGEASKQSDTPKVLVI